jgi:DNA polymerase III alpha subunit
MVYQEDVTKVAMKLAGFLLEDADQLRKVLSKKHKERLLRDYKKQFCDGARQHGVPEKTIKLIWEMIMSFAGYSFCKPHSASYAQVSFKCAYLRAHYPAEFLAAVISNQGGFYSTFAYLSEARRMGLAVQPPDINASAWAYSGAGRTIRVGLMQIKGLNRTFADRLIEARHDGGPFHSFQDFYTRLQPDPAQTRALIRAGCFDTVAGELTRPALMWRLYASRSEARETPDSGSLLTATVARRDALPIPDDYSASRKLTQEVESFGFPFSRHPLELYRPAWEAVQRVQARDMNSHVGQEVTMLGWPITEKMTETKKGESMSFLTLEDYSGLYEATFFPEAYRRFCQLLSDDRPYLLDGIVEEEFSTYSLTVKGLRCLSLSSRPSKEVC